jgi:hypothetical protein
MYGCWVCLADICFSHTGSNTLIIKSLKDEYGCIWPTNIKDVTSTWIVKNLLLVINAYPNISSEALYTVLDDSYEIKLHPMQF